MGLKERIKMMAGWLKSRLNHVTCGKRCYIGLDVKIINSGGVILFDNKVAVRPGSHLYVDRNARLSLGEATEIGRGSTITASHSIVLGRGVLTGPNVFISDHNHEYKDPLKYIYLQGIRMQPDDCVIIGEGTWIGTNAVIVGNVRIGKQCVVGANSVVTHDIPDYSVAAGIPAKVIKQYNFEKRCWQNI